MKSFNARQWGFIVLVMAGLTYAISTVAIFPLNGMRAPLAILQHWRFMLTWEAMLIPLKSAYQALGIGFVESLLVPLMIWIKRDDTPALYGDAQFATPGDIQR